MSADTFFAERGRARPQRRKEGVRAWRGFLPRGRRETFFPWGLSVVINSLMLNPGGMAVEVLTVVDFEVFQGKLKDDLEAIKSGQREILDRLGRLGAAKPGASVTVEYITAQEFMDAVQIRRWKFNQLIEGNMIRTIKKKRKIYVPVGEVERFFRDETVR